MTSYVVALEKDVRPNSIVRSMMGDKPLVIWRGASGAIHVWLDRCPHRSVRLSAGRNMGDYLEGVYHGWRFDESGLVTLVPALQGRTVEDIRATVYSTTVADGFVWASHDACTPAKSAGEPCYPVHIAAPIEQVRQRVDTSVDHLTPWGKDETMVYPTGNPEQRRAELSAIRLRLEES
ncbi:Rieske 2Fe-2S domain-containing protein [Leisingera sp.]|uniref:Rieske 2Fe-2S domain-containing protein n=1 Tax=Leisingera sp. TaxID=1879318 RepID=UPI002B26AE3E|nr:Rieske 2Fe-2S domain-containing protein [Leisingera sp.]